MFKNRRKIQIEWGDCDPAGIVYFPRYFEIFDACTAALFEKAGLPKHEMLKRYGIVGIPMVDTRAKFIGPATFGDKVEVESRIADWGDTSFSVEHKVFKGDKLIAEGFEKRVWTVRTLEGDGALKSQTIPAEVKQRFA
ncbi:MAG TPA: acyl-CoA thioesterase [Terriglobales bacterium]|nr:acyl-CoA thioesterase [Terriglobales bacterium]